MQAFVKAVLTLPSSRAGATDQSPSALHQTCLHALLQCIYEAVQKSEHDADLNAAISVCGLMCTCLGQQAASASIAVVMRALVGGDGDGKKSGEDNDEVGDADGGGSDGVDEDVAGAVAGEKGERSTARAGRDGVLCQLKRYVHVIDQI